MNARPLFGVIVLVFGLLLAGHPAAARASSDRLEMKAGKSRAEGTWEIDLNKYRRGGRSGLNVEIREGRGTYGFWVPNNRAPELPKRRDGEAVDFTIPGDAGDLRFRGEMDGSVASGKYAFEPNASFVAEVGKFWMRELSREDLLELALADVTVEYVKELSEAGVDAGFDDVLKLRRYGLRAGEVKEFAAIGFKKSGDITRLRSHGITADYARRTRELNYGKDVEELVQLRNHGINPEYLQEWKKAGFAPEAEEAIRLRNQGLNADYAAAWKKAGFDFSYDELIKARNHGVPSDFAEAVATAGNKPALDEVIKLRNFGVNAEFYREIKKLNAKYTAEDIVRLRQNGVQTEYIRALQKSRGDFTADEIVKLRNNGVPADYVAALNVEGRAPLDSGAIIELRSRGVSAETARKLRQ